MFHELCSKITDEPLSQQAKLSAYLNGIQDRKLYEELIIEPVSGTRWTDFNKLYEYVMNKYSILRLHNQNSGKKTEQSHQHRNWRRLAPRGMKTNIPSTRSNRPRPFRLTNFTNQGNSSRQPWSNNNRLSNTYRPNPRFNQSRPNQLGQRRPFTNSSTFNRHSRPNNHNQMSNNYFKKPRGSTDNHFQRNTPQSGNNKPSHLAAMDATRRALHNRGSKPKSTRKECPHCFQNHHPSQCPHQH